MSARMELDKPEVLAHQLASAVETAKAGNVQQAVESLLAMEKQCRQAEDESGTKKVAVAILKVCYEQRDMGLLKSNIVLLSKRRAQFPQVVGEMVRTAIGYLDEGKLARPEVFALMETLLIVSAGRMVVEVDRARLVLRQARMLEADGDVRAAALALHEVTVETLGSMDKREKLDYILEQMRLCLAARDYNRALIISRKVSAAAVADPAVEDLKLRYHAQLVEYHAHEQNWVEVARSYLAAYGSPSVAKVEAEAAAKLRHAIAYIVLAPHGPEQHDLLLRIKADKNLDSVPEHARLVRAFTAAEVLLWTDLRTKLGAALDALPDVFAGESGPARLAILEARLNEHNMRVIAGHYTRIPSARLAALLALDPAVAERVLSDMVASGALYARTDRPAGVIEFRPTRTPSAVLNSWAADIGALVNVVEQCTQSILKENILHGARAGATE